MATIARENPERYAPYGVLLDPLEGNPYDLDEWDLYDERIADA
jgi:hypothetical protein